MSKVKVTIYQHCKGMIITIMYAKCEKSHNTSNFDHSKANEMRGDF